MKNWLVNDSISFFLDEQEYVNTVALHKFFIDKDYGARLLVSIYYDEITKLDKFSEIDLMHMNHGRLMARIVDCEIKQKWFDKLVINSRDDLNFVNLYFYIKGKIAFINWNLMDDK